MSQGAPSISEVLPPSSRQLSDSFVAVFGQNREDLSKCQLLIVNRNAYKTLVEERVRVNSVFGRTTIDQQAMESLPENGVPQQLIECGVQMTEVDKYSATRCGPGTLRDPLDKTQEDDDASDEISDASSNGDHTEDAARESENRVGQPAPKTPNLQLNQFETPLGLDPTSTPDFVQHVAAFKAQLDLVQDAVKQMRSAERSADASATEPVDLGETSAQAAAEERELRGVVLGLELLDHRGRVGYCADAEAVVGGHGCVSSRRWRRAS